MVTNEVSIWIDLYCSCLGFCKGFSVFLLVLSFWVLAGPWIHFEFCGAFYTPTHLEFCKGLDTPIHFEFCFILLLSWRRPSRLFIHLLSRRSPSRLFILLLSRRSPSRLFILLLSRRSPLRLFILLLSRRRPSQLFILLLSRRRPSQLFMKYGALIILADSSPVFSCSGLLRRILSSKPLINHSSRQRRSWAPAALKEGESFKLGVEDDTGNTW